MNLFPKSEEKLIESLSKYTLFRVQERKYSSNIIEGGYWQDNKIIWTPVIAPLVKKQEGDAIVEGIMKILTC